MSASRTLTILGSTGSVGQSTLAVLSLNPDWSVHALTAHTQVESLAEQCQHFNPRYAVIGSEEDAGRLQALLQAAGLDTEALWGADALSRVAADPAVDTVMAAIVGAAGLAPTLAAVTAGKTLLLANKEALVMSGELFMAAAQAAGSTIIPIDSEHNAVFQCLPAAGQERLRHVSKVVLTASGGPFLDTPVEALAGISPDQACAHPNWEMGRKISVDSATMMNKGLELIEACYLFGLAVDQVEVVIHPQSIVHSMVYYRDGSVLAQMANPDMRVPIAAGLAWPQRLPSGAEPLDLTRLPALEFRAPDLQRFPCLGLGLEAARQGGTMPAVVNAANEVAVAAFLDEVLRFDQIPLIIEAVMSKIPCGAASSLAIIQDTDTLARKLAKELITKDFQ